MIKGNFHAVNLNQNKSFHFGQHSTVLQAEVMAVEKTATFLLDTKIESSKILINCDTQSAIQAIDSTIIKNKTNLAPKAALNALGGTNEVTFRWIPAHCGYVGNELADQTAKRGYNDDSATRVQLPIPRSICYAALRRKTRESWAESYELNPLCRDKFAKELAQMNRRDLRVAT